MTSFFPYPRRTICDVVDEMRKAYDTRNFSYLLGLIEEVQSMVNKMEASLEEKKDVKDWTKLREELKVENKELEKKKEELKGK